MDHGRVAGYLALLDVATPTSEQVRGDLHCVDRAVQCRAVTDNGRATMDKTSTRYLNGSDRRTEYGYSVDGRQSRWLGMLDLSVTAPNNAMVTHPDLQRTSTRRTQHQATRALQVNWSR